MATCSSVELRMAAMDAAVRSIDHAMPEELRWHLEECAECRRSVERSRRIAKIWGISRPSDDEVENAIAGFVAKPQSAPASARPALAWATAGALLGLIVCFAIPRPGHTVSSVTKVPESASYATGPNGLRAQAHVDRGGQRIVVTDRLRIRLAENEVATVTLGDAPVEVHGPKFVEFFAAADQASGWRMEFSPKEPDRSKTVEPAPSGSSQRFKPTLPSATLQSASERSAWQKAASALEQNDHRAAQRALSELEASREATTRDAARLARAELLIAENRISDARPLLERLAESGATPLIRRRAAELLSGER